MRFRSRPAHPFKTRRHNACTPSVVSLETRQLMASSIIETPLSPGSTLTSPSLIARASDGAIWSVGNDANFQQAIQRTDAEGVSTIEATTSSYWQTIRGLVAGKDGVVWALVADPSNENSKLWKMTADYIVTAPLIDHPDSVTVDADGDAWVFTMTSTYDPEHNYRATLQEFDRGTVNATGTPLVHDGDSLIGVTMATDGAFWFARLHDNNLSRLTPEGNFSTYDVGLINRTPSVVAGPNGSVWVGGRNAIQQPIVVNVTPDNVVTRVGLGADIPSVFQESPAALAAAPDGSVWYIDDESSTVGRATLAGETSAVPMPNLNVVHVSLVSDGGSGVYYSDFAANSIFHLTTYAPEPGVTVRARSFGANEGTLAAATTVATFTTTDVSAFAFDFIARYQIDNQPPHDGVILSDGNGGFVVQAGETSDIQTPGPHFLTVTIIDAKHGNAVGSASTGFAVATIENPPVTVNGWTFGVYVGSVYAGPIGWLSDPVTMPYPWNQTTVSIDWGDGSPQSTWVYKGPNYQPGGYGSSDIGAPDSGHMYVSPGTYTVAITANHGGAISVGSATANVSVAPVQNLTGLTAGFSAGNLGRARVATFTASPMADPSLYAASVDWAGGQVAGEIVSAGNNYEVWATIKFPTWGTVPLTVSVTPAGEGVSTQANLEALITPAPITATALPITTKYPGLWAGSVATFTSFNPASKASDYRASVESADGGSWTAQVLDNGDGYFEVFASHAFTQTGILATTIRIDNVGSTGDIANAATLKDTAQVALPLAYDLKPVSSPFVIHQGETFSHALATFMPPDPSVSAADYKATIDWGDGTTTTGFVLPGNGSYGTGLYVGGAHQYRVAGNLTVTVTLDGVGRLAGQQTLSFAAMVGHQSIVPSPVNASPVLNTSYSGAWASFAVPAGHSATAGDFIATLTWDDGTPATRGVIAPNGSDGFVVKAPHTFVTGGPHSFGVSVTWADGKILEQPVTWTMSVDVAATPIYAYNADFSGPAGSQIGGVVATFIDALPNDLSKYSATIEWGDGTSTDGVVSTYGGQFVVYGTHNYANPGTYTNKVTIINAGAVAGITTGGITVTAAPVVQPPGPGTPGGGTPIGSPRVTASVAQFPRKGVARLLLTYSDAIDPAQAAKLSRYKVAEAGRDGKFGTKDDRAIKVTRATYNANTRQVTLVPKGSFARSSKFRVKIAGELTVLAAAAGR